MQIKSSRSSAQWYIIYCAFNFNQGVIMEMLKKALNWVKENKMMVLGAVVLVGLTVLGMTVC